MRFLIELDGPVLRHDVSRLRLHKDLTGEMNIACPDDATVLRLMQRGASDGELLRGAKPAQWREYRKRFDEACELDGWLDHLEPQEGADGELDRLRRYGGCILITAGQNRAKRQDRLDATRLSELFGRMLGLPADRNRWRQKGLRWHGSVQPRPRGAARR